MIASRRIFIVSSSHPYHNCKIPFLYEHIMTPSMTPRRRRYLFLLSISSRASTSHIVFAPIMFALHSHSVFNQGRPVLVSLSLVHDLPPLLATPSISQKSFISSNYFHPTQWAFRLHAVYHVLSEFVFVLFCTNTSYVTPDFHTIPTPGSLSYSS